jgi:endonuclease-3
MAARKKGPGKKTKTSTAKTPSERAAKKSAGTKSAAKPKASKGGAQANQVRERLLRAIPDPRCELAFKDAFQLTIATILSAQSTDKAVNAVTPVLFKRFPTPAKLAASDPDEVEAIIKRTGFFRAKTKSIRETAAMIARDFAGEVPRTLEEMIKLKGVARKTANVVLGTAYGIASGFVVDTHVTRVAGRLGLTKQTEPVKIEQDLCAQFPSEQWVDMGHSILLHGRYTCLAKAPMCSVCPLNELCPSRLTKAEGGWEQRADQEAARVEAGITAASSSTSAKEA